MFDPLLRKLIDPPLARLGRRLAGWGVAPAGVTLLGWSIGLATVPLLITHQWGWAALALATNRFLDGLDGWVARAKPAAQHDGGAYLDVVADFTFYSAFVLGFGLSAPERLEPALVLMFSFMGTASSFLGYAALAAKHGYNTSLRGPKAIYYLGGLTEGGETIAVFVTMLLFPQWFTELAYGFAAACGLTTLTRTWAGWRTFRAASAHANALGAPDGSSSTQEPGP